MPLARYVVVIDSEEPPSADEVREAVRGLDAQARVEKPADDELVLIVPSDSRQRDLT